jgi:hypothetical protein
MMTDTEKCRMIATFEGIKMGEIFLPCSTAFYKPVQLDKYGNTLPDYPHDLNATMRAARKLLPQVSFFVTAAGQAGFADIGRCKYDDDPARAAFEALAAYLLCNKKD